MNFNSKKCKVFSVSYLNERFKYGMNRDWFKSMRKDLGVIISRYLILTNQCLKARKRVSQMLFTRAKKS